MATTCAMCNSTIEDDNQAVYIAALTAHAERYGWSSFEGRKPGTTFSSKGKTFTLVDSKTDPGFPKHTYDGTYEQGSTFDTRLVFQTDSNILLKKTGFGDSYGDIQWDGPVTVAKMTEKVVKIYE